MAGKRSDLGPTGVAVSRNVRRFREIRRLNYAELSRNLAAMGREIPPLGLRRIEAGERRVDADDLVALAIALGVSPATLLMPSVATKSEDVAVTGKQEAVRSVKLWNWLVARNQLDAPELTDKDGSDEAEAAFIGEMAWMVEAHPGWMVGGVADAVRRGLSEQRARIALDSGWPSGPAGNLEE